VVSRNHQKSRWRYVNRRCVPVRASVSACEQAYVLLFVASTAKLSLCCNCSGMGTERTMLITINCPTVFG